MLILKGISATNRVEAFLFLSILAKLELFHTTVFHFLHGFRSSIEIHEGINRMFILLNINILMSIQNFCR